MSFSESVRKFQSEWLPIVGHGSALMGALLIGFIWLSVNFFLENERNTAEQAAVKNSMNLAGAFDEHLSRSLSEIDRALKLLRNRYARAPDEFDLDDWLKTVQLFDNEILQVSIIDRERRSAAFQRRPHQVRRHGPERPRALQGARPLR